MKTVYKRVVLKCKPIEQALYPGADHYNGRQVLASTFDSNGNILNPLTEKESLMILPHILGIDDKNPEWIKTVMEYWKNISVVVPYEEGLTLEVGKIYNSEEDYKKDLKGDSTAQFQYVNPNQALIYLFALKHHRVANTFDDLYATPKIRFYIQDKEIELRIKEAEADTLDNAMEKYLKIKEDVDAVENALYGLGVAFSALTVKERKLALRKEVERNPKGFNSFMEKPDKDLIINLKKYIHTGIIKVNPTNNIHEFGDLHLGVNFEEVVAFAKSKDAKNMKAMDDMKALYKAKQK